MIGSRCMAWLGLVALQSTTCYSVLAFAPTTTTTSLTLQRVSTRLLASTNDDETKESKAPRHDVRSNMDFAEMDPAEAQLQAALAEHQQHAPKMTFAQDIRTLVQYNHGFAVMSTNSKSDPGYPGGSVVGFAPDDEGRPMFIFSGMSTPYPRLAGESKMQRHDCFQGIQGCCRWTSEFNGNVYTRATGRSGCVQRNLSPKTSRGLLGRLWGFQLVSTRH